MQVVPWGLRKLLNWIKRAYSNIPVLITENGISDKGETEDIHRIKYIIVSFQVQSLQFLWESSLNTYKLYYRIFSNLIRTSFLPPCIVRMARTPALSFGQTPARDRESNLHLPF
jgi:hypothetical protein